MRKELTDRLDHGVEIGPLGLEVVEHVRGSRGSETMVADAGKGIAEHTHGKSLYFAQNAHLTLEGTRQEVGLPAFYALIPEGVPHGWQHAGGEGQAVITSFEPGHDTYETYSLQ